MSLSKMKALCTGLFLLASILAGSCGQCATLPQLSVTSASVTEGDSARSNMVFTVALSQASNSSVRFDFATADGTAKAVADYGHQREPDIHTGTND